MRSSGTAGLVPQTVGHPGLLSDKGLREYAEKASLTPLAFRSFHIFGHPA